MSRNRRIRDCCQAFRCMKKENHSYIPAMPIIGFAVNSYFCAFEPPHPAWIQDAASSILIGDLGYLHNGK